MESKSTDHPSIAILGAGIGGIAAAAFLHKAGLASTVYEQASEMREVGAGLVVSPNAARLLRRLGVMDEFERRAVALEVGWEFRRWEDGQVLSSEDLTLCAQMFGEHTYTAHRADLHHAIRSTVPGKSFRLGHRCVGVELGGSRPVMYFADGTKVEPDVLIGADGVHSVVRSAIAGKQRPVESGICAFRALIPTADAPPMMRRPAQTLWIGPGHHLVHYPVSAGALINLVALAPAGEYAIESWSALASRQELFDEFVGWDRRVLNLIESVETPGRWALLDREPLSRWSVGTTTLLGDAAHPMFPFFAQGAAQAIEDGAVLADCLASGLDDPATALMLYEQRRLPRTTQLQQVSHARAHINHLPDGPQQQARDAQYARADPLMANSWIYSYTV